MLWIQHHSKLLSFAICLFRSVIRLCVSGVSSILKLIRICAGSEIHFRYWYGSFSSHTSIFILLGVQYLWQGLWFLLCCLSFYVLSMQRWTYAFCNGWGCLVLESLDSNCDRAWCSISCNLRPSVITNVEWETCMRHAHSHAHTHKPNVQ